THTHPLSLHDALPISASPQPTPNTRLPKTSRRSMRRGLGMSTGAPSRVRVRLFMYAKAPPPTATAPAMTSASEGSQAPARSRKRSEEHTSELQSLRHL